jgi:probable addiction module antidote protein
MARDVSDHRGQPKMVAKLLNNALAKDDPIAFVKAIGDVTRAQGMTKVSQETGLDRRSLYKSFGGE